MVVPVDISQAISDKIQRIALQAFTALNCAGMARVDVFLTPDGKVVVNEVNTLPNFTNIQYIPKTVAGAYSDANRPLIPI